VHLSVAASLRNSFFVMLQTQRASASGGIRSSIFLESQSQFLELPFQNHLNDATCTFNSSVHILELKCSVSPFRLKTCRQSSIAPNCPNNRLAPNKFSCLSSPSSSGNAASTVCPYSGGECTLAVKVDLVWYHLFLTC
jgi:hypothetical protein